MCLASRCKVYQDANFLDRQGILDYIFLMRKTLTKRKDQATAMRSRTVRKTITLDGDLAQDISSFVIEKGASEKIVINNLIRIGLIHEKEQAERKDNEFSLPIFPKGIGKISRQELNALLDEI